MLSQRGHLVGSQNAKHRTKSRYLSTMCNKIPSVAPGPPRSVYLSLVMHGRGLGNLARHVTEADNFW
jgi:hypothetical protein